MDGLVWRKSSRSGTGTNGNCVEVAPWRKSSFSGGNDNAACVEVAKMPPAFAVRDSKNPAAGILTFPPLTWREFCDRL
ncbi:DUF397 domain-containing protein [Kibdelosporangium persicum]|uniref:DUF397 domain-containing protein n=1 Tax=Kibdelosporangium persicum TaxID=2698649 RepID=UPI0015647350|nr:DUF397 domain-containing protein [Kibdelosporangium persicum]